jgi:F-box protein 11
MIQDNHGAGIVVGVGNKSKVFRNDITKNDIGIEIYSANPYVY